MATKIAKNPSGSVTIGSNELPSGNYHLIYETDGVRIRPLFPNLPFTEMEFKLSQIVDDGDDPIASMAALKIYLSEVFYATPEPEVP